LVHHPPGGAHRFPEIGCVRVEVAAHQAAHNQQPAHFSRIKTPKQHNADQRARFFNAIGHLRHFERPLEMSAMPPIATKNGEPLKRDEKGQWQ
jgi:hypothetical protein